MPLFIALGGAALPVIAQNKMFKCVVHGQTTYQQTACPENLPLHEAKSAAEVEVMDGRPASRQPGSPIARKSAPPDSAASAASAANPASAVGNSQPEAESTKARGKR
jgi:hypothetical protein